MEVYKYTFDKGSKKFLCPNCNKKTFVKYIDTETGNYLIDDFGKCEREQNCNYHKAPPKGNKYYLIKVLSLKEITDKAIQLTDLNCIISIVPKSQILEQSKNECWISEWFLKNSTIQYLTNEFKYNYSNVSGFVNEVKQIVQPPTIEPSFHSLELLDKMYNENKTDHLTEFLKMRFSKDEVFKAMLNYFITGTNICWFYSTVFWQIDIDKNIRSGKILQYNSITGKRDKTKNSWVHSALRLSNFNLKQCFFGEHLLKDNSKTVAIVEGDKTAIIMSCFLPQYIWLSSSMKDGLNADKFKALQGRTVILFPDLTKTDAKKNCFVEWSKKANEFKNVARITVSDYLERIATDSEKADGLDIADYFIKYRVIAQNDEVYQEPVKCIIDEVVSEPLSNIDWSIEISELETFYNNTMLPTSPIKLNQCETITDIPNFITNHLATVKHNNGNMTFLPYFNRLHELKSLLQ